MAPDYKKRHDALLCDLDMSIEKALDTHLHDLAGALYRIQGSAKGWCELEDCGPCPLAPHMCINDLDGRVKLLAAEHHALKRPHGTQAASATIHYKKKSPMQSDAPSMPVSTYFSELHTALTKKEKVTAEQKFSEAARSTKLRWQSVNKVFEQHLSKRLLSKQLPKTRTSTAQ